MKPVLSLKTCSSLSEEGHFVIRLNSHFPCCELDVSPKSTAPSVLDLFDEKIESH
jgi:hypothetical protein